jgi:hypothetical protein
MVTNADPIASDSSDDVRDEALTRLKKKRDLSTHVFMYVAVNATLVVIWAIVGDGGLFWPIFPILGWGIGLAANVWDVYGRKPITEEEIARETERMRRATG